MCRYDRKDALHNRIVNSQLPVDQHADGCTPSNWQSHELACLCSNSWMYIKPEQYHIYHHSCSYSCGSGDDSYQAAEQCENDHILIRTF